MQRILPAYPLFVKDPNFSLWTASDELNKSNVQSWYGEDKPIYGFVKTDEGTFCFLGDFACDGVCVKKAKQLSVSITAFTTDYKFEIGNGRLSVSFVSPLLPTDADIISMPVCYMNYAASGVKSAEVSLFVNRKICYNAQNTDNAVRGGVVKQNGYETAFMGLKRQQYLSSDYDRAGADNGWFYIAGESAFVADELGLGAYVYGGSKDFSHTGNELYIAAICGKCGRIAIAYDDIVSINYFGSFKKTAYLETRSVYDAIAEVMSDGDKIDEKLRAFDCKLKTRADNIAKGYYTVLCASLRQCMAAHKLVKDDDGNILFLSKECGSNGCIATVDISYPSMPLFLPYNTELIKGMMRPVLKFAQMPVWKYDFAPHDAGTYPACCGQVYGLKCDGGKYHAAYMTPDGAFETHYPLYLLPAEFDPYDLDKQMPIEECANMLIMFAACYKFDGDINFFAEDKGLCRKWADYLVRYGLRPENQLCTDDFAGHLKNNLNLAIKATVAIGAYAMLEKSCGDKSNASKYLDIAKSYAKEISALQNCGHLPLTWDSGENTYSLKYNLAFDGLLGLNLFSRELKEREVDYYLTKLDRYGVPLDSRASYTKSDWLMWAAALTTDKNKKEKLVAPLADFLKHSQYRVPFADWYDTKENGDEHFFRARSVVGGHFILFIED